MSTHPLTQVRTQHMGYLCWVRTCDTLGLAAPFPGSAADAFGLPWLGAAERLGFVVGSGPGTAGAALSFAECSLTLLPALEPIGQSFVDCAYGGDAERGPVDLDQPEAPSETVGAPASGLGDRFNEQLV